MRTVDDLQRSLERHAGSPHDTAGVLPAVEALAGRIRRRRRMAGSAAVAVAVVAAGVTVPLVAGRPERGTPPSTVATTKAARYRTATQVSVELTAGSPFTIINRVAVPGYQGVVLRNTGQTTAARPESVPGNEGADVLVYDPGAFDPAPLRGGTPVTVSGRAAWYVAALPGPAGVSQPVLGWEPRPGVWAVVYGVRAGDERLIEVAESIHLVAPHETRTPVQFGWVPDALPVSYVQVNDAVGLTVAATISFGAATPTGTLDPPDLPLTVRVVPASDRDGQTMQGQLGAPKPITGHDTWYLPFPSKLFSGPETGSEMVVTGGGCRVLIQVADRERITEAELDRMIGAATFNDCSDPAGWKPLTAG